MSFEVLFFRQTVFCFYTQAAMYYYSIAALMELLSPFLCHSVLRSSYRGEHVFCSMCSGCMFFLIRSKHTRASTGCAVYNMIIEIHSRSSSVHSRPGKQDESAQAHLQSAIYGQIAKRGEFPSIHAKLISQPSIQTVQRSMSTKPLLHVLRQLIRWQILPIASALLSSS